MIKIWRGHLIFYAFAFALGMLLITGINKYLTDSNAIQELQIKDMDVLKNVKIIGHEIDGEFVYLHVVGEKVRSDCGAPIKLSGFYDEPLTPFHVVDLKKNLKGGKKMPDGFDERPAIPGEEQDFDWWAVSPIPNGPFYLYIDYLCGQNTTNPYIKKNIFGPFNI